MIKAFVFNLRQAKRGQNNILFNQLDRSQNNFFFYRGLKMISLLHLKIHRIFPPKSEHVISDRFLVWLESTGSHRAQKVKESIS